MQRHEVKLVGNQQVRTVWDDETDVRKDLTDEWKERGIFTEKEYAILTNVFSPLYASDAGALDVEEQGLLPPGKAR